MERLLTNILNVIEYSIKNKDNAGTPEDKAEKIRLLNDLQSTVLATAGKAVIQDVEILRFGDKLQKIIEQEY